MCGTVGLRQLLSECREKGGRTKAKHVKNTEAFTLQTVVIANVALGSTIHTDEAAAYAGLAVGYDHQTVNHSAGEYVRDGVTINGVESVWAVLKRFWVAWNLPPCERQAFRPIRR